MNFTDRVELVGEPRKTADGYLVVQSRVARTGIQDYLGSEVDRPDMPIVRVYRPEEEVFARDSMASYAHRPITDDHPSEMVSASNWRKYAKGHVGSEVARDGEFVAVPLIVMDNETIGKIDAGKIEWSMGYTATLDFKPGVTPSGEKYDAVQRNLRMNHLSLVDRARGGDKLRIGLDSQQEVNAMDVKTQTVLIDGLPIITTDAGAAAVATLQKRIETANTASAKLMTDHAAALAAKDVEIANRDAKISELNGKVLTDAQIDKMVADRALLLGRATKVAALDYAGKSAEAIRSMAVSAKLGDEAIKDKSAAYIEARFDTLCDAAGGSDPIRDAFNNGTVVPPTKVTDNGQAAYDKRLTDAWKGGNK